MNLPQLELFHMSSSSPERPPQQDDLLGLAQRAVNEDDARRRFLDLADGKSGALDLERAWLRVAYDTFRIFQTKQRDYGPGNIAKFGEHGVAIRVNDKVERLANLIRTKAAPQNESLDDTWFDIADYGIIGLMCRRGDWPGVPKA